MEEHKERLRNFELTGYPVTDDELEEMSKVALPFYWLFISIITGSILVAIILQS